MKTMQAEYRTDIARLAERIAERETGMNATLSGLREDIARRDADAAKRETRLVLTTVGMFIVGLTVLGFVTA
ncbi:MAG: hypothetical protein OXC91_01455 [Rhodobacteraceae bacterium]|nr:hypothetical protein [Paracoccaceae bacterium]